MRGLVQRHMTVLSPWCSFLLPMCGTVLVHAWWEKKSSYGCMEPSLCRRDERDEKEDVDGQEDK
jgi:hypothetical protein